MPGPSQTPIRLALLCGASLMTLLVAAPAEAQMLSAVRPGGAGNTPTTAGRPNTLPLTPEARAALDRQTQVRARVANAQEIATQAQAAARAANVRRLTGPVVNGLGLGALNPSVTAPTPAAGDPTGFKTWQGADLPTQVANAQGGFDVTVKQTQERAVLSWDSFNVGAETLLKFDQGGNASWVALNRVTADVAPSQILGSIKADGSVLVLNPNGVIFGGGSRVNVRSLVATSANYDARRADNSAPADLRGFNDLFLSGGTIAEYSGLGAGSGAIRVEAGAEIASSGEGFLLLAGTSVWNAGTLRAPDGQIALMGTSGGSVTGTAANLVDTSLVFLNQNLVQNTRGYLWSGANGAIHNTGIAEARRGSIYLDGSMVLQDGILLASTDVSRNGFINIEGNTTLGGAALTAIVPETTLARLPLDADSQSAYRTSLLRVNGANVTLQSGTTVYAPSGHVMLYADVRDGIEGLAANRGTGTVTIQGGALIDVSGLKDVAVSADRNAIAIAPVTGNDLRDSPSYREDSFLRASRVYVDPRRSGVRDDGVRWIGSPLIEAGSYAIQAGASVEEIMTVGGTVEIVGKASPGTQGSVESWNTILKPGQGVIVEKGAVLDLSGGWSRFEAGSVRTSQLVTSDGRVVDIGEATLSDTYVGFVSTATAETHARWGVTDYYTSPFFAGERQQASYTQGKDAGALAAYSQSIVLDGTVHGQAFAGERQSADGKAGTAASAIRDDFRAVQADAEQLPTGALLLIDTLLTQDADSISTYAVGGADIMVVKQADLAPLAAGTTLGATVVAGADGALSLLGPTLSDEQAASLEDRMGLVTLGDEALSGMGLGGLTLRTRGDLIFSDGIDLALTDGAALEGVGTTRVAIGRDARIVARSGRVRLQALRYPDYDTGSRFRPVIHAEDPYSVIVDGTIDVSGRWANLLDTDFSGIRGPAYLNGGSIELAADGDAVRGGGVRIRAGAALRLNAGGLVDEEASLDLRGRGGDLTLANETVTFVGEWNTAVTPYPVFGQTTGASAVKSGVTIDAAAAIDAFGFHGGGSFVLHTPQFQFGEGAIDGGTRLALDFFSSHGFAAFDITSYLSLDGIATQQGGSNYNLMATQTLRIGAGETLALQQRVLPSYYSADALSALTGLASGGDVLSVVAPELPDAAWDRRAVAFRVTGPNELIVEAGGAVIGEAGSSLSVGKILNEGTVRLPGGTITVEQALYANRAGKGIRLGAEGTLPTGTTVSVLNYVLGELDADQGLVLAKGSVTDLAGVTILNPRAVDPAGNPVRTGRLLDGGSIKTVVARTLAQPIYAARLDYAKPGVFLPEAPFDFGGGTYLSSDSITVAAGATLDLRGTSDSLDVLRIGGSDPFRQTRYFTREPQWSAGGQLIAMNGATLSPAATILATGGAAQARGGLLAVRNPVLSQTGDVAGTISADMIEEAGFSDLAALGNLSAVGDVALALDGSFYLGNVLRSQQSALQNNDLIRTTMLPGLGGIATTGSLAISASYMALAGSANAEIAATRGSGAVTLSADAVDISGLRVRGDTTIRSSGAIRFFADGVNYAPTLPTYTGTLSAAMAVTGDLRLEAAQIYAATGVTASTTVSGDLTIMGTGAAPATPYSAGSSLSFKATNITQGGILRAPFGQLTLDATAELRLLAGSISSVSANGLSIPYGSVTDGIEWYYAPTGSTELAAPPSKLLQLKAIDVDIAEGATVDLTGGGDVYGYEFQPGNGGSRDVLDRFNSDLFSGNAGYQYPDGRQVYAIVPGLSDDSVAAFDALYSFDYGELIADPMAGRRVYLESPGAGLAAGWYTLLPAKYALLPGGVRIVERTELADESTAGLYGRYLDGTAYVSGRYGGVGGASESALRTFELQSQGVFRSYSRIGITSGQQYFSAAGQKTGATNVRLPSDAGRLVLTPSNSLSVGGTILTAAAVSGRGAQVDISAANVRVAAASGGTAPAGTLLLAAPDLTRLNAESLLIGGSRTENADGTTSLSGVARALTVESGAQLQASGEILLLTRGVGAQLVVEDAASLKITGTLSDRSDGAFTAIGDGALLRLANGAERLLTRSGTLVNALLDIGAATLDGETVLFDTSTAFALDPKATFARAETVALGAGRIGVGADPLVYTGLVLSDQLIGTLTQSGGRITLRGQSAIEFAPGEYRFGDVRIDTGTISGLGDGEARLVADVVTLGNAALLSGGCSACAPSASAITIDAGTINFATGAIAPATNVVGGTAPAKGTLGAQRLYWVPAGTVSVVGGFRYEVLEGFNVLLPVGTPLEVAPGTAIQLPVEGADAIGTGTRVTADGVTVTYTANGNTALAAASAGRVRTTQPNGLVIEGEANGFTFPAGYKITASYSEPTPLTLTSPLPYTSRTLVDSITLRASEGIIALGERGGINSRAASLTIETPFIGDRAVPLEIGEIRPLASLLLSTEAALTVRGSGADPTAMPMTPGTSIALVGDTVSIDGTVVRASAGTIELTGRNGVALSNGAHLLTPGYVGTFGPADDSVNAASPRGAITIASAAGDVALGANTRVSVGGTQGAGGTLTLSAANGAVRLNGTIDGAAPDGGSLLAIDTGGALDLMAIVGLGTAAGFDRGLDLRVRQGDLRLDAGQTIRTGSLRLVADTGLVRIAGTIDTSGAVGGNIELYGAQGVTVASTGVIDTHADGYGADTTGRNDDSRQARAGDLTLGTDYISAAIAVDGSVSGTSGAIRVEAGARLDLSAHRPGERLVRILRLGQPYYQLVAGDEGGVLTLRAPVLGAGTYDVNATVASAATVLGARQVVLESFRRWDLPTVAASGLFTGITGDSTLVTLDPATAHDTLAWDSAAQRFTVVDANGGLNFLSDRGTGTLVAFVQDFQLTTQARDGLGGLASRTDFVARPGIDLATPGALRLENNWNLGAAVVDVDAAVAAGVMVADPVTGRPALPVGNEAALLDGYTGFVYRTGQSVFGVAPSVTLRGGGDMTLAGGVSDGMFNFRDLSDPLYGPFRRVATASSGSVTFGAGCRLSSCRATDWTTFRGSSEYNVNTSPLNVLGLTLSLSNARISTGASRPLSAMAPYNAAANGVSPSSAGGAGGAFQSDSDVYPRLGPAAEFAPDSASYRLVAGASLGAGGLASPDPLAVDTSRLATLAVTPELDATGYKYVSSQNARLYEDVRVSLNKTLVSTPSSAASAAPDAWLAQFIANNPQFNDQSVFQFSIASESNVAIFQLMTGGVRPSFTNTSSQPAGLLGQFIADENMVMDSADPAKGYRYTYTNGITADLYMSFGQFKKFYTNYLLPSFNTVRVAASGPVDGQYSYSAPAGRLPVRTGTGAIAMAASGDVILADANGSAPVFTIGRQASSRTVALPDPISGATVTVSAAAVGATSLTGQPETTKVRTTEAGGDIRIAAGRDLLAKAEAPGWYMVNSSGFDGILGISPATSGIAALAGGDVTLTARRDLVGVTAGTLAAVEVTSTDALTGSALATFGSGDLVLAAGRSILAPQVVLLSGTARIEAGANVDLRYDASGSVLQYPAYQLYDGDLSVQARGTITGLRGGSLVPATSARAEDGLGFLAAGASISLLANGTIRANAANATLSSRMVLPGSLSMVSLAGDLNLAAVRPAAGILPEAVYPTIIHLFPDAQGQLNLLAAGSISGAAIGMEDGDPGWLPGLFSSARVLVTFPFSYQPASILAGRSWDFPAVVNPADSRNLLLLHSATLLAERDATPVRIAAGRDLVTPTLSLPKSARISAGRDILDMVYFGQNIAADDITRIVAGRDVTASSPLTQGLTGRVIKGAAGASDTLEASVARPAVAGNSYYMGGSGDFYLEAGRDMGPFLSSATVVTTTTTLSGNAILAGNVTIGGGVLSVGYDYNPYLEPLVKAGGGTELNILFGIGKGQDWSGLADYYLNPANAERWEDDLFVQKRTTRQAGGFTITDTEVFRDQPLYAPVLIAWMKNQHPDLLAAADPSFEQAWTAFRTLAPLQQREFLMEQVYFRELQAPADPDGNSYLQYSRGYRAANTLFPAALGYTENALDGGLGAVGNPVPTGDLDLRLSTLQTVRGGDINILGPGGRVLGGSNVRTVDQLDRRTASAFATLSRVSNRRGSASVILAVPTGLEGILTLRGGALRSFTDGDFVLNQSRAFTQFADDITMWSSNGDLNAGQGPKTTSSFPPASYRVTPGGFFENDTRAATTGAGIAAFDPDLTDDVVPFVSLLAPRGTVDAGDAGIRVQGNLSIAAAQVANVANIEVSGQAFGIPVVQGPNVSVNLAGSQAAAQAAQSAQAAANRSGRPARPLIVTVEVLGFGGTPDDPEQCLANATGNCRGQR